MCHDQLFKVHVALHYIHSNWFVVSGRVATYNTSRDRSHR